MNTTRNVLIAALVLLAPAQLLAVPAWSRAGDVSCSACHATPTWQLNNSGLDFLKNGHRSEPFSFDRKEMKLENYFSFVWKYRASIENLDDARTGNASTQKPKSNFEQHSFSIYTGGPISERFSYFTEMYLSENTGATSGGNIVQGDASRKKLAEAFLQYNHPVGDDMFVAVRVGEILPEILHVFGVGARSAEQRATVLLEPLAGNTNTYRPFSRQQGFDVKLNAGHFEGAIGVLNGSDTSTTNSIDANSAKDVYFSALYNFDEFDSAVGVFHYNGTFTNYATKQDFSTTKLFDNDFTKTGLMGRFIRDNWRLVGAYFLGEETLNVAGAKADNAGFYALVDYNFTEKYGVFARYDQLDPNTDVSRNEINQVLLGFNANIFQSEKSGARFQVEFSNRETYLGGNITTAGTTKFKDRKVVAQITWGF